MNVLTFEEFVEYYIKHKRCINDIYIPTKELSENKLKQKYVKYIEKLDKMYSKEIFMDKKYQEFVQIVNDRDKECQFFRTLTDKEKGELHNEIKGYNMNLDVAHIFAKGAFPHLKYDPENGVLIYRYFHKLIDKYIHPITKESITKDIQIELWKSMVGHERYENLRKKAYKIFDKSE